MQVALISIFKKIKVYSIPIQEMYVVALNWRLNRIKNLKGSQLSYIVY